MLPNKSMCSCFISSKPENKALAKMVENKVIVLYNCLSNHTVMKFNHQLSTVICHRQTIFLEFMLLTYYVSNL